MKISDLYGKEVESLDKKKSGYILSVSCKNGEITRLICSDWSEREFLVDVNDITETGEKVIFRPSSSAAKPEGEALRLGVFAYSRGGKYMGVLKDCEYKGTRLLKAYLGNKKYDAQKITFGDAAIVDSDEFSPHDMFISAIIDR